MNKSCCGTYALYDDFLEKHPETYGPRAGGIKRARGAIRVTNGCFMPKAGEAFDNYQENPNHGKTGGTNRANTATRNARGQFMPNPE